ncbi:MAG TPA: hypothetical protein VHT30_00425 [Acidimicrobiales bacterium]|jgi:hypothetical protein|nr:hypothetical protein [Acidimicrobiales bacterium]
MAMHGAAAALAPSTNGSLPAAPTAGPPTPTPRAAAAGIWEPVDAWVSVGNGAVPPPPAEPAAKAETQALYELVEELKLEVRRLNRVVETMTEGNRRAEREAVREDIDARFKWLTEQVSERLVTLGNEMAAVRRHLDQRQTDAAAS